MKIQKLQCQLQRLCQTKKPARQESVHRPRREGHEQTGHRRGETSVAKTRRKLVICKYPREWSTVRGRMSWPEGAWTWLVGAAGWGQASKTLQMPGPGPGHSSSRSLSQGHKSNYRKPFLNRDAHFGTS